MADEFKKSLFTDATLLPSLVCRRRYEWSDYLRNFVSERRQTSKLLNCCEKRAIKMIRFYICWEISCRPLAKSSPFVYDPWIMFLTSLSSNFVDILMPCLLVESWRQIKQILPREYLRKISDCWFVTLSSRWSNVWCWMRIQLISHTCTTSSKRLER